MTESTPAPARDRAAEGRLRKITGRDFENELDTQHQAYEYSHWGKIRRNHAPTKIITRRNDPTKSKTRITTGVAHVDRTGWVSVRPYQDATCGAHEWRWRGDPWTNTGNRIVPVAFDAKVMSAGHASYVHETSKQHQLHDLRDAANAGEWAFLLVLVRSVERVFAIPIANHFSELIGRSVKLYERERDHGAPQIFPLLPSTTRTGTGLTQTWDWIPLLGYFGPG